MRRVSSISRKPDSGETRTGAMEGGAYSLFDSFRKSFSLRRQALEFLAGLRSLHESRSS